MNLGGDDWPIYLKPMKMGIMVKKNSNERY